MTARLYDVPADASASPTIGGPDSTLTVPAVGQNGTWSFAAAAGQRVYFQFTGGTFGSLLNAWVTIRRPDGTSLASSTVASSTLCGVNCSFDTLTLPATGTMTLAVGQNGAWTFTGTTGQRLTFTSGTSAARSTHR
jgi:hypothetical protein